MTTQKKSWLGKYWKDLLKVVTAIFLVIYVAALSGVWADRNYSSNFWPNFFEYSGYIIGGLLLIGWVVLWTGQKKR